MAHTSFPDPWAVILLNTQERREHFTWEGFFSIVPWARLSKDGERWKDVNIPGLLIDIATPEFVLTPLSQAVDQSL